MVTPIVVILCFLFFGVSHVLWFSPQPGDPVNQGEDETHEGNSCISMMTPRCHMNDQEDDCPDGSDDDADDEAAEGCAMVLLVVRGQMLIGCCCHHCLTAPPSGQ